VRAAGGNPLLLQELAATGDPSPSLKLSFAARLRSLSADAREAAGLLALAQRPLPASVLGGGQGELVASGIAFQRGRSVELRHALLGDAMVGQLDDADARDLHSKLAARLRDPGESARHHLEAGERDVALAKARRAAAAATSVRERAEHLRIAALSADGEEADHLRLEAADTLLQASRIEEADEVAQSIAGRTPALRVAAHAMRARTRLQSGDLEQAARELETARTLPVEAGSETDLQLKMIQVDLLFLGEARLDEALAIARPLAVAAAGTPLEPAVLTRLATLMAELEEPREEWVAIFHTAIAAARKHGQTGLELETASHLVLNLTGEDWPEYRRITEEMARRAQDLRLLEWDRRFRAHRVSADLHEGNYRHAIDEAERLLTEPLNRVPLNTLLIEYTQILIDLGEFERAEAALARLNAEFAARPRHRGMPSWLAAELSFWGGRAAAAFEAAERSLVELGPDPAANAPLVSVTRAWAAVDLGRVPEPAPDTPRYDWLTRAGTAETAALIQLRDRPERAAEELLAAADLWAPHFLRHDLRCRWGAGEACRRAGRTNEAVRILEEVEARAERFEFAPLLGRIRRSLRLAGVRRSAPRLADGEVTAREREILELVGRGLSNPEIARRLGIGAPTVSDAIASASRKLGAKNRAQAAALARR
jgi:DNA-binding CsgD family transcriptional regulator